MSKFFENTIHLDFPAAADIEATYLGLPAVGRALVTCRLADMAAVLASLESIGFFGMRIRMPGAAGNAVLISAFKGKAGACHDTGKTAAYKGCAAAVLDDDNHVLFGEPAICEKTARIYSSPVYAAEVDVSSGDPELLARLEDAPVVFDCNTFDADVKKLVASLVRERGDEGPSLPMFYPGPFKLLILQDGTMLRRGEVTLVGSKHAQRLAAKDGCIALEGRHAAGAVSPVDFVDAYQAEGGVFLLGDVKLESTFRHSDDVDMAALEGAPEPVVSRLKKMVERGDRYFILTGSDPRDEFGCCPSGDVGASNRLVEAGLLDCWHTPAPAQSCASTVYAFRGEISVEGKRPSFTINNKFRRRVMDYLGHTNTRRRRLPVAIMRWTLLIFVVLSIGFVLFDKDHNDAAIGEGPFAREVALSGGDGVVVCFFHRADRCDFCVNMETLTKRVLASHFSDEVSAHQVFYRDINMDVPQNRDLAERYGVFTSSIVLVRIRNGKVERSKLLEDAWDLAGFAGSEEGFLGMMRAEMTHFTEDVE